MEEKSIIDNLLDEIKNGFPLRKSQVEQAQLTEKEEKKTETTEIAEKTNEDENKEKLAETKKAKRNWKKTKMLASLIGKSTCLIL